MEKVTKKYKFTSHRCSGASLDIPFSVSAEETGALFFREIASISAGCGYLPPLHDSPAALKERETKKSPPLQFDCFNFSAWGFGWWL